MHSLTPSDYEEIVELLIEQLGELEPSLAARELTDKHESERRLAAGPYIAVTLPYSVH